jgi:uncharacterized protein
VPTVADGDFEWDDAKAASNAAKHGVSFVEAATIFSDPAARDFSDSHFPDRLVTIGFSANARLLYVVTTDGSESRARVISAREVTAGERRLYEEQ